MRPWMPPVDRGVLAFFHHFKTHRGWALVIGAINLLGIVYGFYYYSAQFATTPWYWWPLVPDSPLAVLWAELALIAFWLGRKPGFLDALAVIGNIQVGLWTVYVLLAYEPAFHTLDFLQGEGPIHLNSILLVAHAGMAVLALIFLQGLREGTKREARIAILIAGAYYLFQDAIDYWGPSYDGSGCGLRPYTVPCDAVKEPALAAVTIGLSLLGILVLVVTTRDASTAGRKSISPPG